MGGGRRAKGSGETVGMRCVDLFESCWVQVSYGVDWRERADFRERVVAL